MYLLLIYFLQTASVYSISLTGIAESSPYLRPLFESIGFSSDCVANALASSENFSHADYNINIAELLPVLKTLTQEPKCNVNNAPNFASCPNSDNIASTLDDIKSLLQDIKSGCFASNYPVNNDNHRPKNCAEILTTGDTASGPQTIFPSGSLDKPVLVYCDQTTDGGGWTVVQNRDALPIRKNFERTWQEYVKGFGNITGEFWLGLEIIHVLVNSTSMELRVDLQDFDEGKGWAKYDVFSIGDPSTKYKLNVSDYSGDAGDSFANSHNGMQFSTPDSDNDAWRAGNCAKNHRNGWWHEHCGFSNINGYPHVGNYADSPRILDGVYWKTFRGYQYSLKKTSMKVRPKKFN